MLVTKRVMGDNVRNVQKFRDLTPKCTKMSEISLN